MALPGDSQAHQSSGTHLYKDPIKEGPHLPMSQGGRYAGLNIVYEACEEGPTIKSKGCKSERWEEDPTIKSKHVRCVQLKDVRKAPTPPLRASM